MELGQSKIYANATVLVQAPWVIIDPLGDHRSPCRDITPKGGATPYGPREGGAPTSPTSPGRKRGTHATRGAGGEPSWRHAPAT